ncbi:unnamed protein product [Coregonus sp. 'balchen']|nr:unnamed protein product [Coregonus sp. 'balchen']
MAIATKLGFSALDRGSLSAARELEDFPLQLFPQWRLPLRIAISLSTAFFYLLIRDIIYAYVTQGNDIFFRIMVLLANKLYRGTKYRKQLGLLALGFVDMHVLYTLIIPICCSIQHTLISQVVNETKANKTTPFEFDNTEAWGTDSFVLGILGFCLYVLLVITSLPSVGAALSWREFSFVQNKFLCSSTYKWYTPPGYMQCLVLPSVVLVPR